MFTLAILVDIVKTRLLKLNLVWGSGMPIFYCLFNTINVTIIKFRDFTCYI